MRNVKKVARLGLLAAVSASVALLPAAASADTAPTWRIDALSNSFAQAGSEHRLHLQLANIGDETADGSGGDPIVFTASLPDEMSVKNVGLPVPNFFFPTTFMDLSEFGWSCSGDGPGAPPAIEGAHNLTCTNPGSIEGHSIGLNGLWAKPTIKVNVDGGGSGTLISHFTLSGAGAGESKTTEITRIAAQPSFGIDAFDVETTDKAGHAFTRAGAHPDAYTTTLDFNVENNPRLPDYGGPAWQDAYPVEATRDISANLPPGFIGNPTILAQCTGAELVGNAKSSFPACPVGSQVGTVIVRLNNFNATNVIGPLPVFNMVPPPGAPAQFGFNIVGTVITLKARLRSESDYGLSIIGQNTPEGLAVAASSLTIWGTPAEASHDPLRACPGNKAPEYVPFTGPSCETDDPETPFLRMPTRCTAPGEGLPWSISIDSWENPGAFLPGGAPDLSDPAWDSASIEAHEAPGYPLAPSEWNPEKKGVTDCDAVPVKADLTAQPTTLDTESSSGLEVHVEVANPGLNNKDSVASSDLKNVTTTLPQGMTINPSQAEGLGVCSPAQYESSRLEFHPDGAHGCPSDSKIGTVSVKTPILEETIPGNVYVAKPYENPFNSLLALYIVIEEPMRGVLVKLPGELRLNETTGRIEAEFDNLPQTPFESFDFKFREGARAPLVTPSTCGSYETVTEITGWSDPENPITSKSTFQITRGIGGAPCPAGGVPGFKPGFSAGSINNNAGDFSPFNMRITRKDGEQDMTRFSATLPPGVLGKLAGVDKCPVSAVALAKSKQGREEIASPSCPPGSAIGRSMVGAGVGSVLTWVPGKVYLGGPFNGRPLSVIAITPVVAGPFDVGTVAVQEALTLNPKTAEVEVDGSASDPIPHILKGIPAKLRDLRVYVDRDKFTLNPTSCAPSATDAELFGGGANAFTSADDVPVLLSDRYQAASCSSLGFKPRLALKLKGGTKRGGHPGLTATYRPRPGNANVEGLVVRLPRSAFLDQAHIRTICTRVQFAAESCPKAAQYGYIKAWTPLLEEPLQGPVWLRSSNHKLPDLVFDLHGLVDVEVATRIDSVRGGVRASVESVPDAPLSKVVLRMQGAKKGLIVNSRNLCTSTNRANVQSDGHNGKLRDFNPVMQPECGGKKRKR